MHKNIMVTKKGTDSLIFCAQGLTKNINTSRAITENGWKSILKGFICYFVFCCVTFIRLCDACTDHKKYAGLSKIYTCISGIPEIIKKQ